MWLLSCFILCFAISSVKSSAGNFRHQVKSCQVGDVVQNECNKCLCTSKAIFECEALNCNRTKDDKRIELTKGQCNPNQLYVQKLITCICTKDGRWPHKNCYETFQSLPPSNVVKHECEPDSYVSIDCNVCRCGPKGIILSDRCTKNTCDEEVHRRNMKPNSMYSNCEVKNWYSLAPCQFCYCINQNKLVCNTGNYYSKKLELGSYNLRICGKDLITEAVELIPGNQKALRTESQKATTKEMARVSPKPTPHKMHKNQNIAIEVNRESNEIYTLPTTKTTNDNLTESVEYYTDSEEAIKAQLNNPAPQKSVISSTVPTPAPTAQQLLKDGKSTKFPIVEGDEMLNESPNEEGDENSSENESVNVGPEVPETSSTTESAIMLHANENANDNANENANENADGNPEFDPNKGTVVEISKGSNTAGSYQYAGNTIKISLPKVLNKVFQLALRKSMVTLSKETKCKPGSTTVQDCNMCFCLKNSKLLCTKNKCGDAVKSIEN
ncbi:uncharacterized protein LOC110381957 [Helicoverpa armigera]|uniref:uncharacterized protein LOC110381957 n=1 Tax=Helicoverpa armigera TaxID=29058 RepID=UPI003082CC5B